jgi:hypothetical protein
MNEFTWQKGEIDTSDWNWDSDKHRNAEITEMVDGALTNTLRNFPPDLWLPIAFFGLDGCKTPDDPATLELCLPGFGEDCVWRLRLVDVLDIEFFQDSYPYRPTEGALRLATRLRELAEQLETPGVKDDSDRQQVVECSECGVPILLFRAAFTGRLLPGEYVFDGDNMFPQFRHPRCTHPQMSRAQLSLIGPRVLRS